MPTTTAVPKLKREKDNTNIDERLEALIPSVELIAQMQVKTKKEIRRLARYVRTIVLDHEARLLALEGDDDENGMSRNE